VAPGQAVLRGPEIRDERTVPGRGADFADVALDSRLASTLESEGIERLYDHQAEAVDAVRDGNNVVPRDGDSQREEPGLHRARVRARDGPAGHHPLHRAAGRADQRPDRHALRTGPGLGFASGVQVDQYTGRQSKSEKEAIRERQPTVLLTTPDMLHYGIPPTRIACGSGSSSAWRQS